jgi:hypothetical protein
MKVTTELETTPGATARHRQPAATDPSRFEIRDGSRRITCTVSDEALAAVSGLEHPATPSQRRDAFSRFRTLINEAARLKAEAAPGEWTNKQMVLGTSDLRRVPQQSGTPVFGVAPRQKAVQPG